MISNIDSKNGNKYLGFRETQFIREELLNVKMGLQIEKSQKVRYKIFDAVRREVIFSLFDL